MILEEQLAMRCANAEITSNLTFIMITMQTQHQNSSLVAYMPLHCVAVGRQHATSAHQSDRPNPHPGGGGGEAPPPDFSGCHQRPPDNRRKCWVASALLPIACPIRGARFAAGFILRHRFGDGGRRRSAEGLVPEWQSAFDSCLLKWCVTGMCE